jgi:heme-degrading monooxygenase HmoA
MRAWREHPEHQQAQELGRKLFYSTYRIQVCPTIREYSFPKKADVPHSVT